MSRLECINDFASLPLYAQALVAVRMVRRAAMAKLPSSDSEFRIITQICDAAESCCIAGKGVHECRVIFDRAMAMTDLHTHRPQRDWLRRAVGCAIDSVRAADDCQERPFEATVTRSAQAAIAALGEDENLSRMQLTILLASDIDQMLFACGEVDKLPANNASATYQGLGSHIMARLAPVHPLTFIPREPTPEERAR